jgi:hypothetical protein
MPVQFKTSKAPDLLSANKSANAFFKPVVQTKLSVNQPNDVYEQEADAVAEKVMRMPVGENSFFKPAPGIIHRKCSHCEEEEKKVQMSGNANASGGVTAPQTVNDVVSSPGQSLDSSTKSFMESRMGYDFGNVQVHNDSSAHQSSADINALAYTHGNHIVFGEGQYQPGTDSGKQLLAHELVHVVQQGNDTVRRQEKKGGATPTIPTSFIFIDGHGDRRNDDGMQGISDHEILQKLGDIYRERKVCWEGNYVGVELHFGTAPIPGDGSCPRKYPPYITVKLAYKEAGGFTTYKYEDSDARPVWDSGPSGNLSSNWHPAIQTFFTYPLTKKGTLKVDIEMMDIEDDRLLLYQDTIDFVKCDLVEKCTDNALATNRWAVIPDNGDPIHPLTGSRDDGERYEIYKENGKDNYFICIDETTKLPVDRDGSQPSP